MYFLHSAHTLSTISVGITIPYAIWCQWKKLAQQFVSLMSFCLGPYTPIQTHRVEERERVRYVCNTQLMAICRACVFFSLSFKIITLCAHIFSSVNFVKKWKRTLLSRKFRYVHMCVWCGTHKYTRTRIRETVIDKTKLWIFCRCKLIIRYAVWLFVSFVSTNWNNIQTVEQLNSRCMSPHIYGLTTAVDSARSSIVSNDLISRCK